MADAPQNLVTRAALQNALGISWTTLERWITKYGCPVEKKGGQGDNWQFDLPEVVRFARDPRRRLMPPSHKIDVPCQECGDWVRGVYVGRSPYTIFCEPCREDRRRMFEEL